MAIKDLTLIQNHLFLCNGGTCKLKGAEESSAAIRAALVNCGVADAVHTTKTLCNGRCKDGPVVISAPGGWWFKEVTSANADKFVQEFIVNGNIPDKHLLYKYGETEVNGVEPEAVPQSC